MAKKGTINYDSLVAAASSTGGLWEDPDFPCDASSLFKNPEKPPADFAEVSQWLRIGDLCESPQLFVEGVEAGDVIQGGLGDCWFLGGLSVVATRTDLLSNLFVKTDTEHGIYILQFFKSGEWLEVAVDDRIPCNASGKPAFARCKDENETWVMLLEKAYAKLHGCFESLEGGSTAQAMVDLTGGAGEKIFFARPWVQEEFQKDLFWHRLERYVEEGFLMGCSFSSDDDGVEEDAGMGILSGHAYGLLNIVETHGHRLIKIRNPWGLHEWTGAWSDNAPEWTPEILAALNHKFEDDGTFYMALEDFQQYYNKMYIARLYFDDVGEKWLDYKFDNKFAGDNAGGCINASTWHQNVQYALTTETPDTQIFISVIQPDVRMQGKHRYEANLGFYVMKHDNLARKKTTVFKGDIVGRCEFAPAREVSNEVTIEPGQNYVLIPCTFNPGVESDYVMTLWSEHKINIAPIEERPTALVEGEWDASTGGGCFNYPSWRNNPQFALTIKKTTEVSLILEQGGDDKYIGFYVCKAKSPKRKLVMSNVVGKTKFLSTKRVTTDVLLTPTEHPYVVIPCTFKPGERASFTLSAFAEEDAVELAPLAAANDWEQKKISGEWKGDKAGGCQNHASWTDNPMYRVKITQPTDLVVLLTQTEKEEPFGFGFYVAVEPEGRELTPKDVVGRSDFVSARETTCTFVKVPANNYVIVPATFDKGVEGDFALSVYSDAGIELELV